MQTIVIELLKKEVALLHEELDLLERRSQQIRELLEQLEERLVEDSDGPESSDDTKPEIEIEIVVEPEEDIEIEVEDNDEPEVMVENEDEPKEIEPEAESMPKLTMEIDSEIEEEPEEKSEIIEHVVEKLEIIEHVVEDSQPVQQPTTHRAEISMPKIDNIRSAISLGDRFLFQRELFSGDGEKMNKTIEYLNQLTSLDEAMQYISKKFEWNTESTAYELFVNLLKRRF